MSLFRYVVGIAILVTVCGACAYAALTLRRTLVPAWAGAPARLVEAVLGVGALIAIGEALGTAGVLTAPGIVCASAVVVVATWRYRPGALETSRPPDASSTEIGGLQPAAGSDPSYLIAIAVVAGAIVTGHWATAINDALNGGMQGPDTLAYHGPIAATFAQLGSVLTPPHVYGDPAVAFYPASSELLLAIGILVFSRDLLSPFINLGWLWVCLLAAWCIGRPLGLATVSTLLVAVVIDLPVFSTSQPGSGDNDVMALALMLSGLALLLAAAPRLADEQSHRSSVAAIAVGGLAAGLSVGTKLGLMAPVGLMTLVVLIAVRSVAARLGWIITVLAGCTHRTSRWGARFSPASNSCSPMLCTTHGSL